MGKRDRAINQKSKETIILERILSMRISDTNYESMVLLLKEIERKLYRDSLRKEIDDEDNSSEVSLLVQVRAVLRDVDDFNS